MAIASWFCKPAIPVVVCLSIGALYFAARFAGSLLAPRESEQARKRMDVESTIVVVAVLLVLVLFGLFRALVVSRDGFTLKGT